MKIMEAIDRNPTLTGQLLEVWESSVKATHLFLSEEEIENISAERFYMAKHSTM